MKTLLSVLAITLAFSSTSNASIEGRYRLTSCAQNTPASKYYNIPFMSGGSSVEINGYLEILIEQEGDKQFLSLDNGESTFSWPLFPNKNSRAYKNAQYQVSENLISYKNNKRYMAMCSAGANTNIQFPCIKSLNEEWSFENNNDETITFSTRDGENKRVCTLTRF